MRITQNQASQKFTISNLTESELIELYHCVDDKMRRSIYNALLEAQDEQQIMDEYGLTVEEYLANVGVK